MEVNKKLAVRLGQVITPARFILAPINRECVDNLMRELGNMTPIAFTGPLLEQQRVVVTHKNLWERAVAYKISTLHQGKWKHYLFLVDRGIKVESYEAYEAHDLVFQRQPFLAFEFVLKGIVSKRVDCDSNMGLWTVEAYEEVQKLLGEKVFTIVCTDVHEKFSQLVIGDVSCENQSLSQFLTERNYGVYNMERFSACAKSLSDVFQCLHQNSWTPNNCNISDDDESDSSFYSATSSISQEDIVEHVSAVDSDPSEDLVSTVRSPSNNSVTGSYKVVIRQPPNTPIIQPVRYLWNSSLCDPMRMALNGMNMTNFRPLTANALPAIATGENTAIIGKRGKKTSSVLGIMNQVFLLNFNDIPKGYGPLAIFLCRGTKSVQQTYTLADQCISLANQPFVVENIDGVTEKQKKAVVGAGCHILVTTPHCLVRLLEKEVWTSLARLRWLVVGDADILLEPPFRSQIDLIRTRIERKLSNKIQCVFTAEHFTKPLRGIIKKEKFTLVIKSHMEAALFYSNTKQTVEFGNDEEKLIYLNGWLENHRRDRVAITCKEAEEVSNVASYLSQHGWHPLVVADENHITLKQVVNKWYAENRLLVLTDSSLINLNIYNATVLVHYSLPSNHKSQYWYRFSLMMDNFRNHFEPEQPVVPLKTLLLLKDRKEKALSYLIDTFKRCSDNVSAEWIQMAEYISAEREKEKHSENLCNVLLSRGKCSQRRCKYRHQILPEKDVADENLKGEIIFHEVYVEDGSTLYVKLISAEDTDCKFMDLTHDIEAALNQYLSEDRFTLGSPERGMLCAYENEGKYVRAKIVEVNEDKESLQLELIDSGCTREISSQVILKKLPDSLTRIPAQAVKLYLAGLLPIDFDDNYHSKCTRELRTLFKTPLKKHQQWRGNIRAAFTSGLVVDKVRIVNWIPGIQRFIDSDITPDGVLKSKGLAIANPNHLPLLTAFCAEAGITLPEVKDYRCMIGVKPKWAFLPKGETLQVITSYVKSSQLMFLWNYKFTPQLKEVQTLCNAEGEAELSKRLRFNIKSGQICLAKLADGEWNRARVLNVGSDGAECYMVDYGYVAKVPVNLITPISEKLVDKLPFQAIECSLGGVKDCDSDAFLSRLDELVTECYGIGYPQSNRPQFSNGSLYKVKLVLLDGTCVNRKLVEDGLLEADDDSEMYFTDEPIPDECDDVNSDEDDLVTVDVEELFKNIRLTSLPKEKAKSSEITIKKSNTDNNTATEKYCEEEAANDQRTEISQVSKAIIEGMIADYQKTCPLFELKGFEAVVKWHHKNNCIVMRFMVPGAQSKTIWATMRYFRILIVSAEGVHYLNTYKLFGVIDQKCIQSKITLSYVEVICPCLVARPWPRLISDKSIKNSKIVYDIEFIAAEETTPIHVPFWNPHIDDEVNPESLETYRDIVIDCSDSDD